MEAQWKIGADMIFAFDECTSPTAPYEYQKKSLARTYEWAKRSIEAHEALDKNKQQALFGVVQGGRHQDLREEAARTIGTLPFDGFGIGGSFTKDDIGSAVAWVNKLLPEDKPRHLLGIGEPRDLFDAVEVGCDLFDCIAPTRMGRHGTIHTKEGRINIRNAQFVNDFNPIENDCSCYTCTHHTKAYLAHLFRADEMTAATLASIHNLHFILRLVESMRASILDDSFLDFKKDFCSKYYKNVV
jgi:queuine tRNA-ribosyltransferase